VPKPGSSRSPFLVLANIVLASCFPWVSAGCFGQGLTYPSIEDVRVSGLPALMSRSHELSDVLLTSLDTILHDRSVCCGKDSALEDRAERADASSLKDIATKLQGRHLLSDGRPMMITAESFEPAAINSGMLIGTLRDKHALLFAWNSRLYVCYGVTYRRDYDAETGVEMDTILTFLLLDTRYSDSRRGAVFNRETDDWNKVQGILRITAAQP
jgi:hypothetical protein